MNTTDDLMKLLQTKEELNPELVPYLDEEGVFGPSLKHPLVFSICHGPMQNAYANKQLEWKRDALNKAAQEGNWHTYVYLHERPYRLDAFVEIEYDLTDTAYWDLLGDIWVDSENIWQSRDEWRSMLESDRTGREFMSSEEDRKVFSLPPEKGGLLPETVVYRGYRHEDGLDGFSFSLNKAKAKWFAKRFPHQGGVATVATCKVKKEHVVAYHTGRGELEIVALPEDVYDVTVEEFNDEPS